MTTLSEVDNLFPNVKKRHEIITKAKKRKSDIEAPNFDYDKNRREINISEHYTIPSKPASFSGISKIREYYRGKVPTKKIKKELSKINSYTLHREAKRPRVFNPFHILKIRQQIQIDLIDISQISESNDGVTFLFVSIDMFSKLAYCTGLKTKSAKNTLEAMKKMIDFYKPHLPKEILSDQGTEFKNKTIQEYLDNLNISYRYPYSDIKCAGVERLNKTIQNKLYRYMTENDTDRYINVLPAIMESYNNTKHGTIKMEPRRAELKKNHLWVRDKLMSFYNRGKKRSPKLKIGDIVRIQKLRGRFARGYKPRQVTELFKIVGINTRMTMPMYLLKSIEKNDLILGGFYESQLTKIIYEDDNKFKIDRIIDTRVHKGKKQSLVKWTGHHETYNSWINTPNLSNV